MPTAAIASTGVALGSDPAAPARQRPVLLDRNQSHLYRADAETLPGGDHLP